MPLKSILLIDSKGRDDIAVEGSTQQQMADVDVVGKAEKRKRSQHPQPPRPQASWKHSRFPSLPAAFKMGSGPPGWFGRNFVQFSTLFSKMIQQSVLELCLATSSFVYPTRSSRSFCSSMVPTGCTMLKTVVASLPAALVMGSGPPG